MKIRSLVEYIIAPEGKAKRGEVIDLKDEKTAQSLIDQGKAEAVTEEAPAKAEKPPKAKT